MKLWFCLANNLFVWFEIFVAEIDKIISSSQYLMILGFLNLFILSHFTYQIYKKFSPSKHGNRKAFIWGRSYLKYVYCEYNICNYNIWIVETCQIFLLNICIWQTRKSLPQMSQTKLEGKVHTKVLMPSSTSLVLLKKVLLN